MQNQIDTEEDHEVQALAPGDELLYGQYVIERHLVDGGFGMTYLARDSLDRRVVVKECFPSSFCHRVNSAVRPVNADGQEPFQSIIRNFLREALRLAKFEHPHIVGVHQVFQENNTAYIAMDFVDGEDLITILEREPQRLTSDLITKLLHDTLGALDYVHDFGMLHRDISPDNLLLDANDKLTLIDFGAAREDARRKTRALSTVLSVKDGYSPHEFYVKDGEQDMSSDLYSVGATFYHLITGFPPPESQTRLAALTADRPDPYKPLAGGNWPFSHNFLKAIDRSLSLSQKKRIQAVEEWLMMLDGEVPAKPAAPAAPARDEDLPDGRLEVVISSLVQDTNSDLKPAIPESAKLNKEPPADRQEEEQPAPLVDIFGNPIHDVDAWLRCQDQQAKRRQARQGADGSAQDDVPRFGLSRVLNSLVKKRPRSAAVAQS